MRSVTTATIPSLDTATDAAEGRRAARILGLAIACLVPALFWIAVIKIGAYWLGMSVSPATMAMTGATIAVFLFAVCTPLMLRTPDANRQRTVAGTVAARADPND